MNKLKVLSFEIKDVLGATEWALEPGKTTVLKGQNASGKTTILEGLKTTLGGGNLAKIARIPAEGAEEVEPETVLVLEGDEGLYRIEKGSKKTRVRKQVGDTAAFEDVPQPQMWLSGLFDSQMCNPITFMRSSEKQRILMLLEALPVKIDKKALWQSMGISKKDIGAVPEDIHPLTELTLIRESVFRERTGVKRDAKAKEQSAEQLRRSIPAEQLEDQAKTIVDLDKQISDAEQNITRGIEVVKSYFQKSVSAVTTKTDSLCEEKRSEQNASSAAQRANLEKTFIEEHANLDRRIAAQVAETESNIAREVSSTNEKLGAFRAEKNAEILQFESIRDTELDKLFEEQRVLGTDKAELAGLRESAKSATRAIALREQMDTFDADAETLVIRAKTLTNAIKELDLYRRGLLENLPIPGLEVSDKTITVDNVPYDQLNTAKQMEIAVKIACLRAAEQPLPVVFVDGAEALDSSNFALFLKLLAEQPVQAVIAKVTDDPGLTTEKINENNSI